MKSPHPRQNLVDDDAGRLGPVAEPSQASEETIDGADDDEIDLSCAEDDARWDVFILDDDERDPLPEAGDFYAGPSDSAGHEAWNEGFN